jgi:N-methylhydantoinase B
MVREDVKNGLVSQQAARDIYKVVVDPTTFKIDEAATKKLRERSPG